MGRVGVVGRWIVGLSVVAMVGGVGPEARAAGGAGPPVDPVLGTGTIEGSLDHRPDGSPDTDDFSAPLLPGAALDVAVRPGPGGGLRPVVTVLAPDGRVVATAEGPAPSLRGVVADVAGPWTVRIAGAGGTAGAYVARLRVRTGPLRRRETAAIPPGATLDVPFPGVAASLLSLRLRGGRGTPPPDPVALIAPDGTPDHRFLPSLEVRGGALTLRDLPLDGGPGLWRIRLRAPAAAAAAAPFRLELRATPPPLPRGARAFGAEEPWVPASAPPVEGSEGAPVTLHGGGFSPWPRPRVRVGSDDVTVLSVAADGSRIEFLPPALPAGTVADLDVVNPDGQGFRVAGGYREALPAGVALARLVPPVAEVAAGAPLALTVELDRPAPKSGLVVVLAAPPSLGAVPPAVVVGPHESRATFTLTAGPLDAEGRVRAEAGRVAEAVVRVVAPPPPPPRTLDLTGWALVQTSSHRSLLFPPGTTLESGRCLVVSRSVGREAFEAFWAVALPQGTAFIDGGAWLPTMNGDETYRLVDPDGRVVDGPTPPLVQGRVYERVPGKAADEPGAWTVGTAGPGMGGTPGVAPGTGDPRAGPRITEVADPGATGQYPYEFVEVRLD